MAHCIIGMSGGGSSVAALTQLKAHGARAGRRELAILQETERKIGK